MSYPTYGSILQPWVTELGLRHQGVLLASVRGCDGISKYSNSKPLVRFLRWTFMVAFDEREIGRTGGSLMNNVLKAEDVYRFLGDWDAYPMHFVQHLMHAYEVVAYKHPDRSIAHTCFNVYSSMVDKLHLTTESEKEMDERLTEDRIAKEQAA